MWLYLNYYKGSLIHEENKKAMKNLYMNLDAIKEKGEKKERFRGKR